VEATPAPLEPDTTGIHELLDRWAAALKRGDLDTAAQCYAAVVNTYFTRHDVTREAVRQSIRQARARYGRLDAYRLSGIGITPVSDSRAVATFRKYWQTSGRKRSAGEEEERMTLVRTAGVWQISSEQAEPR
jgi:NAD(P)-dependent dehydrogenase (short-subunit alcohol dehydrogenase family)